MVGSAYYLFIVFHDDDGVAEVAQAFEDGDEAVGVARVQAYGGLVEDIHGAHQRGAQRGGQCYALPFAAAESAAFAVQGEVAQAYVDKISEAVADLGEQAFAGGRFGLGEAGVEVVEPLEERFGGHLGEFADAASADLHVVGVLAEPATMAVGAGGASAVAGQHDAVLYLVGLRLEPAEEAVDAFPGTVAVPEEVFLFLGEFIVGGVDGEADVGGVAYEVALPLLHLVAVPADDGIVVNGARAVGDHQFLVDAHDVAVALAGRAGAIGIVEGEEVGVGFLEGDAVGLEAVAEGLGLPVEGVDDAGAASLEECRLDALGDAWHLRVVVAAHLEAVDEECHVALYRLIARSEEVFDADDGAFDDGTLVALLHQHVELAGQRALLEVSERGEDHHLGAVGHLRYVVDNVAHRVALDFVAADGREGSSDACEEEFHVFVDLGLGTHGGAWVGRAGVLADGYGRGEAVDIVHFGLEHASEELACIGTEALDVASLPFGEEGVESQRRLAAAAEAGDDRQLALGDGDVQILEVVDPCAFYLNVHVQRDVLLRSTANGTRTSSMERPPCWKVSV